MRPSGPRPEGPGEPAGESPGASGGRPPLPFDPRDPRDRPTPRRSPPPMRPSFEERPPPRQVPDQQPGVRILRPKEVASATLGPAVQIQPVTGEQPVVAAEEEVQEVTRSGVLGVNINEGVAHLAVVLPPSQPRLDLAQQLAPRGEVVAEALGEFLERVIDLVEELEVGAIAIARPLKYTNWTYASAFDRISLETCFLLAAHRIGLRLESVGLHHAANVVGLPTQGLNDSLRSKLRIERSVGWQDRWPALLVAVAVLLELQGLNLRDAGYGE